MQEMQEGSGVFQLDVVAMDNQDKDHLQQGGMQLQTRACWPLLTVLEDVQNLGHCVPLVIMMCLLPGLLPHHIVGQSFILPRFQPFSVSMTSLTLSIQDLQQDATYILCYPMETWAQGD